MSTAIFSHLSHSATRSEDAVIAFVRRYGWIMSAPFAAASVALLVTSPWVVSIILGEKYTPALLPLRILSVGPFLLALSHVYSTYYMLACGYDREWLRVLLKSIVVNFAVLIPLLFLVRGSVALAITAVCAELYTVIEYRSFYLRKAKERESAAVAPQAAATR